MQIHITPRHLRMSAGLHQAVAAQILALAVPGVGIRGSHVILMQEDSARPSKGGEGKSL